MDTRGLNQIRDISEQLQRENGFAMTLSLEEEEVDPDQEVNSGTEVNQEVNSGTLVNLRRDRRATYLRRSKL